MVPLVPCPGCGARFPAKDGPVHEYMESSPGCWHAFGEVLAREYGNPRLMPVHRLSVDTYAVQHPGGDSRQAIQSVGVHLARLYLMLERGLPPEKANDAMLLIGKTKSQMVKLPAPPSVGGITVADVAGATSDDAHVAIVKRWAQSAWQAWAAHHDIVRSWASAAKIN